MEIRNVALSDAGQITDIYNHYIATSHATFELDAIDSAEMMTRVEVVLMGGYPFLICEHEAEIVGFAYGQEYRVRPAYRPSVEISVYVKEGHQGKKVGTKLYEKLVKKLEKRNFHAVVAGISLPNEASVRLHEKFGMEKVAHFREVGRKFDRWIDVGYWEMIMS